MPNWKRVILSGSNAHLNEITASGDISGSALSTLHGFGSITASNFGNKDSSYTGSFRGSVELTDTLIIGNSITFEGNTADDHELTLTLASEPTSDVTISIPDATDTLVARGTTDTLTNKSIDLDDNTITGTTSLFNTALSDGDFTTLLGTETLKNKTLDGDTSTDSKYAVTLQKGGLRIVNPTTNNWAIISSSEFASERIQTLPDAAGTFVIDTATQTLTNKTLTNPTIGQITGLADSLTITGDITSSGDISGSHNATSSFGLTTGITGSFDYVSAPNIITEIESGSISTRLTTEEANIDVLQSASQSFSSRVTSATASIDAISSSFQDRLGVSVEDGIAYADSNKRLRNNTHVTLIDSNNTSNAVLAIGGQGTTGNSRLHLHASGSSNYFIGGIGRAAIGAQYNLMVGDVAHVVDGDDNVMVGVRGPSEQRNNTSYATTLGSTVMQNAKQIHATEGIGFGAGKYMVSASENTIIGAQAGLNLDGGARGTQDAHPYYDINAYNDIPDGEAYTYFRDRSRYNTFIGQYAGAYFDKTRTHTATIGPGASKATLFRSGSNNVIIGRLSKPGAGYTQFETVIGAQTIGHGPFTSTIGSGSLYVSSQGDGNVYAGTFTGSAVIVGGNISGSRVSASNIVGTNLIQDSASFSTQITHATSSISSITSSITDLKVDSGSFSTRLTLATSSIESITSSIADLKTRMSTEESNIDDLEAKVGQSLNTSDSPTFAGLTSTGDVTIQGKLTAEVYAVSSSVTHITRSFSSGSTIFGDDSDDTHQVTGSLLVTGSFIVREGDISGSRVSASNIVGTNLIQDSASFSTQITHATSSISSITSSISALKVDSGSFSTRITQATSSISSITSSISALKVDSGSFSTRLTNTTASIAKLITDSSSLSSRIEATELGGITGVTAGTGLDGGGNSGIVTLNVDFSDSEFGKAISGSWGGFITGSGIVSSSVFTSPAQGQARLVNNDVTQNIDLGLETTDAPTFNRLTITDRITATSVTASGDISASGTIFASKFESAGIAEETISFNDNLSITGNISATGNITSVTNITSSGHVSGSSTSTASFGRFEGDGRGLTNVAASTIEYENITNAPSSSFSHRLTIAESSGSKSGSISTRFTSLEGRQIGQGTGIMGGGNIGKSDLTLQINFEDTAFQRAISGSFRGELSSSVYLQQVKDAISGSFTSASSSFSTRATSATASISDLVTRMGTEETNVDALESKVGQSLNTSDSPTFAGLTIDGDLIAQRYIVSSSVTHITSSFSSGSTVFGDSLDDTHVFTGSLIASASTHQVTGSFNVMGTGSFAGLNIGGGIFTSASLAAGGSGGGVFTTINDDNSRTEKNLQITGSMNISSSLTVKLTDSGSTAINTTNINAGFPTANRWQDNLEGSYFNNFDHNTNVSEILRFMAGIISHSIDTASPTANTKTFSTIDTNDNNLGTTDSISGYIPQNYTDIDDADTVKTLKYLITKGWASVGSTIFNGISVYHDNGNSYAIDFDSNSGGSTSVRSSADSELFGLGGLTNGGATQFDVKVIATQSFSDNSSVTTPTAASNTFTTQSNRTFSATSFGTTDGVTLAKIDSANPAVIPSAFQDGKFVDVGGTDLSGTLTRKYHSSKTSFTGDILSVSSSGYYRFHDLKVGIATGSGNFDFKSGTTKNFFYAPVDQIDSDIGTNSLNADLVDVATNIDYTNVVSRSLSGAPYITGSNYNVRYAVYRLFKPMYASSTTLTRLTTTSVGVGTMEISGGTLSTNGGTIQTTGLVFTSDLGTAVDSGVPRYDDRVVVTASLLKKNLSGATNIQQSGFSDTSFGVVVKGRNRDGTESDIGNINTINYHVAGTFGQTAASSSLAIYGRGQGYDIDSLTGTTANFVGETYRVRINDNVTTFNGDLWGASWEGATFKLNSLGDYDLQVKPGFLVDPGGNYGYWYPNNFGSGTYKYYIRYFRHSGTTKTSMTVNAGTSLVNWNSTSNGIAIGIIFQSGTSAGTPTVSTCRIFDISDLTSNLIESGVSADNFKNPFTSDIDLYGNTGGSLSSTTYTIPLRNSDSMILDSNNLNLYVIVRYKGDPTPITGITLSYS